MTEHVEKLRETLDELHQELASLEHVDTEVRTLLDGAAKDIQTVLDSRSREADHSIAYRLGEAARHLGESHPTLAGVIRNLIDTLGQMGI